VVLSGDFMEKLDKEHPVVRKIVMSNLERMKNDIVGYTSLAFTFNEERNQARFIIFNFIELNEEEIKLYEYEDISSDEYLDMLLEGDVLQTSNCSYINNNY